MVNRILALGIRAEKTSTELPEVNSSVRGLSLSDTSSSELPEGGSSRGYSMDSTMSDSMADVDAASPSKGPALMGAFAGGMRQSASMASMSSMAGRMQSDSTASSPDSPVNPLQNSEGEDHDLNPLQNTQPSKMI